MSSQAEALQIDAEYSAIAGTPLRVSHVAIGTWAIGGWMWGGTDEAESVATIRAALDHGINVIDTAPAYGFGRSEEIVGKAVAEGRLRNQVVIATKVGLEWKDGVVYRNASRGRIMREVEDSLRRLRTDYIDIYQVHWPDPLVPIEENRGGNANAAQAGEDSRRRRQQFLGRADAAVPQRGAAARVAVAL
jgi:aryl-alcohol dehydrogenase-like predicted oxidoreductase